MTVRPSRAPPSHTWPRASTGALGAERMSSRCHATAPAGAVFPVASASHAYTAVCSPRPSTTTARLR
jgi:hypothetical protein